MQKEQSSERRCESIREEKVGSLEERQNNGYIVDACFRIMSLPAMPEHTTTKIQEGCRRKEEGERERQKETKRNA